MSPQKTRTASSAARAFHTTLIAPGPGPGREPVSNAARLQMPPGPNDARPAGFSLG